jgi:hypothetical protein
VLPALAAQAQETRMRPMTFRRSLSFVALVVSFPAVLVGCPKKPAPAVEDAAPAPPASTQEVTDLAPLVDEAGPDAADAAPKKWAGGGGTNPNQLKIRACCNAVRAQAKGMGNSPELNTMAMACDTVAAQVGPQGNAPEFNQLRQILKSIQLPAACNF